MENTSSVNEKSITIQTTVNAPVDKVWEVFTTPDHIVKWNFAAPEWHSPKATNDLRQGGKFTYRMEAKDGSIGFDFEGVYDEVKEHELIAYSLSDNRKVRVTFSPEGSGTNVSETFEAENTHSLEMQQAGWQAILDNFKAHAEKAAASAS